MSVSKVCELAEDDDIIASYDDDTTPLSAVSSSSSAVSFDGVVTSTQNASSQNANNRLLCQLCWTNEKDLLLRPCNHMVCSPCWNSWKAEYDTQQSQPVPKSGKRTRKAREKDDAQQTRPAPKSRKRTRDAREKGSTPSLITCLHPNCEAEITEALPFKL